MFLFFSRARWPRRHPSLPVFPSLSLPPIDAKPRPSVQSTQNTRSLSYSCLTAHRRRDDHAPRLLPARLALRPALARRRACAQHRASALDRRPEHVGLGVPVEAEGRRDVEHVVGPTHGRVQLGGPLQQGRHGHDAQTSAGAGAGAGLVSHFRERQGALRVAAAQGADGVPAREQLAHELAADVARAARDGGDLAVAGQGRHRALSFAIRFFVFFYGSSPPLSLFFFSGVGRIWI